MERITEIPQGNYQGYLWYSDASEPDVVNGPIASINLKKVSPRFIVEGYLYDEINHKSYSVKMIDGEYRASCCQIPQKGKNADFEVEDITYLPNRVPDVGHLAFQRIWRPKDDVLCEGMPVLVPQEELFVGFKN